MLFVSLFKKCLNLSLNGTLICTVTDLRDFVLVDFHKWERKILFIERRRKKCIPKRPPKRMFHRERKQCEKISILDLNYFKVNKMKKNVKYYLISVHRVSENSTRTTMIVIEITSRGYQKTSHTHSLLARKPPIIEYRINYI